MKFKHIYYLIEIYFVVCISMENQKVWIMLDNQKIAETSVVSKLLVILLVIFL